jgi:4-hydroxybutyrate CoA-transferase
MTLKGAVIYRNIFMKIVNPFEALQCLQSGNSVYIQSAAAAPQLLINAMIQHKDRLQHVKIMQLHTEGAAPYAAEGMEKHFNITAFFIGSNIREAVQSGRANYLPVFLSEVPLLFRRNILPVDIVLINVSTPDKHGYCSLGVSVDVSKAAIEKASIVIAQINQAMPRTHGDGFIHIDEIDFGIECYEELPEHIASPLHDIHKSIGNNVATLIEDGATLQLGIGSIPDAVLSFLHNHKNLGIHTEMFSDGIIPLVEKGVITGNNKTVHPGKIVTGFVMGSKKLYDFVDDNQGVVFLDIAYVNDTDVIRRNPKVTAINSAIEVDITGQICADSIGSKMYSGVGGQMDFIRGASLSEGGKPIIALPSTTNKGESRIVPFLKPGAGVVTTRSHVHYIVTEFGIAHLFGKNLKERAEILISIAHPNHREHLEKQYFERLKGSSIS